MVNEEDVRKVEDVDGEQRGTTSPARPYLKRVKLHISKNMYFHVLIISLRKSIPLPILPPGISNSHFYTNHTFIPLYVYIKFFLLY